MELELYRADASGNITLFVTTPTGRDRYASVAQRILADESLGGEQVAFVVEEASPHWDGKMEMCGLEFCCNATRSFGLALALESHTKNHEKETDYTFRINTSGIDQILTVHCNISTKIASVVLPPPLSVATDFFAWNGNTLSMTIVQMEGILHVVLEEISYNPQLVESIKSEMLNRYHPKAVGMLFYDAKNQSMIPAVYVRDVDTTYLEGSCGSGTAALACALSRQREDGIHTYSFQQPAGRLSSTVTKKDGRTASVTVEGPVSISKPIQMDF